MLVLIVAASLAAFVGSLYLWLEGGTALPVLPSLGVFFVSSLMLSSREKRKQYFCSKCDQYLGNVSDGYQRS